MGVTGHLPRLTVVLRTCTVIAGTTLSITNEDRGETRGSTGDGVRKPRAGSAQTSVDHEVWAAIVRARGIINQSPWTAYTSIPRKGVRDYTISTEYQVAEHHIPS